MLEYRNALMSRFRNPYIVDLVTRVAREPIRKLAPDDRIIAPLRFARQFGIAVSHYYTGIASVLLYECPDDVQSRQIRSLIKEKGIAVALEELTGILVDSEESKAIQSEYTRLEQKYSK